MFRPLLVAAFAAVAPLAAVGQPAADHPFKGAKVGDYASYAVSSKVGAFEVKGTVTNTVKAATGKEVTLEVTGQMGGMPVPATTQKIDLTKAFDPAAVGAGAAKDAKVEKLAEGAEKITVAGKSYEAKWVTMKVTTKTNAGEVVMDLKAWVGKEIPLGLGKLEMSSTVGGMPMAMRMELTESGGKK